MKISTKFLTIVVLALLLASSITSCKEKANEIFTKVWGAGEAKKTFKFRRGLVIDFVSK